MTNDESIRPSALCIRHSLVISGSLVIGHSVMEGVMSKPPPLRIAVLGAGPIGIEAALYAKACGFAVAVYERGQIGEHLIRWGHVRMFTPFGMNTTPLGMQTLLREKRSKDVPKESDHLTGRQFRDAYLVPLSESETLIESMNPQHAVLQIGRATGLK